MKTDDKQGSIVGKERAVQPERIKATGPPKKKPYVKPALRYERVFEMTALSCGKASSGVPHCQGTHKTS